MNLEGMANHQKQKEPMNNKIVTSHNTDISCGLDRLCESYTVGLELL